MQPEGVVPNRQYALKADEIYGFLCKDPQVLASSRSLGYHGRRQDRHSGPSQPGDEVIKNPWAITNAL